MSNYISKVISHENLSTDDSEFIMDQIMTGKVSDAAIASLLTGLLMKDVTSDELTGFLRVMKSKVSRINYLHTGPVIDVCGTGGAPFKTFNASTAAAFVVAAGGVAVAKHGNRSFTSKCGSADILEQIGVNINMNKETAQLLLNKYKITFLFAPLYHPSMKYVQPIRKELGIRTVFNLLGPLTNPAGVKRQLIGVYSKDLIEKFLKVLENFNYESAMIVHGENGADEIITCGKTYIGRLTSEGTQIVQITPEDLNVPKSNPQDLQNVEPNKAVQILVGIYQGQKTPVSDFVKANAAAGFLVANKVNSLLEGMELARNVIDSGSPLDLLKNVIKESGGNLERIEKLC